MTIDLRRREDGLPLLIGHRGAAAIAPENTIRSFRAAVAAGVDLVELDVIDLPRGPLVVAHSHHLDEVTAGAARGSVRPLSLDQLRELAPDVPTFDEALAFFAGEAPAVGVHLDLKLRTRFDELAASVARFGLQPRTVVSSTHAPSLRAVARHAPGVRIGFTYPHDRLGVSRRPRAWPLVGVGLSAMRSSLPLRLGGFVRRAGATAVMLQHRLVTPSAVERSHQLGAPVLAWTVDDPADLERVAAAGVDGVITNDPRIFVATLRT
jgi:glycerophosphoryl diester phosphodiesterase